MAKERLLVLSVDRDDDLGTKAGVKGPLIGKEDIVRAASALGLADPQDSDTNALFEAVRVSEEMKRTYKTEVAVLTGDRNVGIVSDREIGRQLDIVLKDFKADYALLVTDGSEDEHTLPVITSKVPIISVRRLVVKQAEQLESAYFKVKDFLTEAVDDPRVARLAFGIPALILLPLAIFGMDGFRFVLGIIGAYLFIRGFKLENYIYNAFDELRSSFFSRKFAFFTYIVGAGFGLYGLYRGYMAMADWMTIGLLEAASGFVAESIYFLFVAGSVAWIGRGVSSRKKNARKIASVPVFGLAISMVVYNAAQLILLPEIQIFNFVSSVMIGFALLFVAFVLEWKA